MIKAIIKGIHASYVRFRKKSKWRKELRSLQLDALPATINEFSTNKRILILAPHADDELIGCYQLIRNHPGLVTVLYCSFLGSNYSESNRVKREEEFKALMHILGCEYIISSPNSVICDINKYISSFSPEYVFVPSVIDWQQEHRKVNYLLKEAVPIDSHVNICWYHVSLPIPYKYITTYSLMNKKQSELKWKDMHLCYKSQLHMDMDRFRFVEGLFVENGLSCETYMVLTIPKWKDYIKKVLLYEEETDSLKNTLGNIREMYFKTDSVYTKVF